ncbi:hypothetical protein, partial [Yersinia ruckeri]|uniref:hypothetical protein n=1 Tax=Yersinia ruckeri TaxID=29486 RepID=UPI002FE43976
YSESLRTMCTLRFLCAGRTRSWLARYALDLVSDRLLRVAISGLRSAQNPHVLGLSESVISI